MALTIVQPVYAGPVAPTLSVTIVPDQLVPAQAGYAYVGGGYPLDVTVTLNGEPLDVFWSGDGYVATFSFDFDAPPGEYLVQVEATNPLNGEHISQSKSIIMLDYAYPLEQIALPYRLIPLLETDLNVNEVERLDAIYAGRTHLARWDWPFQVPVPGGIITSRFGGDRIYNAGMWAAHHTGADFRRSIGEPIHATANGWVANAEFFDVRGNVVLLDHGYGVYSQYAHLSEFYVEPGQWVYSGQVIGLAGATGRTNGPHLHFEIIVNGQPVDPIRWFGLKEGFIPPREVIATPEAGGNGS